MRFCWPRAVNAAEDFSSDDKKCGLTCMVHLVDAAKAVPEVAYLRAVGGLMGLICKSVRSRTLKLGSQLQFFVLVCTLVD